MTLETAFRRFTLLPRFIQTGNGEPRKAHYLGRDEAAPIEPNQNQGRKNDKVPKKSGKYRDLADITLGEVEDVYNYFRDQLVPSPAEGWIAKNYFCQFPLKRKGEGRLPVVFGRLKTVYPGDSYVNNVEEMEMYFPRQDASPDTLHIRIDDIALHKPTYSFCVGVKFYVSEDEMADFSQSENIFIEKGFAPLYDNSYIDLLELHEQNQAALPWLYVIGSGWFASIPDSVQPEIRQQLRSLLYWNKTIFNYHPKRYSLHYRSLNEELDFNYGFTEQFLVTPQDSGQVLKKVEESFAGIFMQEMG
jgi:hypothetical protein